jgi:hypothetical protein
MQTATGTKSIAKKAQGAIDESVILAYGDSGSHVKAATAGATKLIGISERNGQYSGPALENQTKTQPGMVVDVITEGIAQCLFGAGAIAYGDPVKPDAQGRAIKANAGDMAIGICDAPAAEGYYGRVKLQIHKV